MKRVFIDNHALIGKEELEIIKRFVPTDGLVFDVGANLGQWTMEVLERKKGCIYHLFEPSPVLFQKLKGNLSREIKRGIIVANQYALSDREDPLVPYYFYPKFPGNSTLYRRGKNVEGPPFSIGTPKLENIEIRSLDKYCRGHHISHIGFLKIDTEGSEWKVLKGAENLLRNKQIDYIQFEYGECYKDSHSTLEEVYNYLVENGYEVFKILPDRLKYVKQFLKRREDYKWCNFLAVSRGLRHE